ncbi:hypothetical protein [Hydrogenophaga sp. Root209]|uniref:hypothetical protein n=1 Tax=Hydrogenophaga sp. Root209 TaxID=1736490 RepID=UPI0012E37CE5|nr:hypothetical protein [Hydrogenophaga sp. Root209]
MQNTTRANGIGSGGDSYRKYTPHVVLQNLKSSALVAMLPLCLRVANGDETGTSLQVRQGPSKYFPGQNGDSDFRSGKKKARCFRIGLYLSC